MKKGESRVWHVQTLKCLMFFWKALIVQKRRTSERYLSFVLKMNVLKKTILELEVL